MKRTSGSQLLALGFLLLTFSVGTASAHKKHRESAAPAAPPAPVEVQAIPEKPAEPAIEQTREALPPKRPPATLIQETHEAVHPPLAEPVHEAAHEATHATPHEHASEVETGEAAAAADQDATAIPAFVAWLGRFHPLVVHFPIALLLASLFAELLFAATGQELFRHAVRFCLWGGALGAALASPLGWAFAASGATESGWVLETHRWVGTSAAVCSIAALFAHEHMERVGGSRLLVRILLVLLGGLIGSTAFLGGSLLYGLDHLAWGT